MKQNEGNLKGYVHRRKVATALFLLLLGASGCKLQALPGSEKTAISQEQAAARTERRSPPLAIGPLPVSIPPGGDELQAVRAGGFRVALRAINLTEVNLQRTELSSTLGARHALDFEVLTAPNFAGELEVEVGYPAKEVEVLNRLMGGRSTISLAVQVEKDGKLANLGIDGQQVGRFPVPKSFKMEPNQRHVFRVWYGVSPNAPSYTDQQRSLIVAVTELSRDRVKQRAQVEVLTTIDPALELQLRPAPSASASPQPAASPLITYPGRDADETLKLFKLGSATAIFPPGSLIRPARPDVTVRFRNLTSKTQALSFTGALKSATGGFDSATVVAGSALELKVPYAPASDGGFRLKGQEASATRILGFNEGVGSSGTASPSPSVTPRPTSVPVPSSTPTPSPTAAAAKFSQVAAINSTYCAGCHNSSGRTRPILTDYTTIKAAVTPGVPSSSDYYTSILSRGMPIGRTLTAAEKETIRSWIADGAKNN